MLRLIKNFGHLLYRVWFYVLVATPILVFSPLLVLTTISEKSYPQFYWLARNIWARLILYGTGCWPKVQWLQHMERDKNYMLVANHTSMLDIMLMLYLSKNPFVFVGKRELADIPVFGFFYKRVCILVERENPKSRMRVYKRVRQRLDQGLGICIFPEGGVPDENVILDRFKDGAFKMAINHKIPIVPMSFLDCKKRLPFRFFSGGPGKLRVLVRPFIITEQLQIGEAYKIKEAIRNNMIKDITTEHKGL